MSHHIVTYNLELDILCLSSVPSVSRLLGTKRTKLSRSPRTWNIMLSPVLFFTHVVALTGDDYDCDCLCLDVKHIITPSNQCSTIASSEAAAAATGVDLNCPSIRHSLSRRRNMSSTCSHSLTVVDDQKWTTTDQRTAHLNIPAVADVSEAKE